MLTRAAIIVGRRVVVVTRRRPILSVATTVGRQHPSGDASISTTLSLKVERKLTTLREEGSGNEERGKKHAGEGNSTGAGSLGAKGVSRRGPVVKSTNMENLENISSSDGNKAVTAVEGHSNDNPHVRGRGNTMRANRRSVERMSRYSKNDNSAQGERGTKPQARRTPAVVKRDAFEEADIKYVTELTSLMKVGNWIKIIDTYKQESVKPGFSRIMYNITITALSKSPRWRVALTIFREMVDAGGTPDGYTFNTAIRACVHGRETDIAFSLFGDMILAGVKPDSYTYTYLIATCGDSGLWERALALLEEMEAAHLLPGSVTFNAAIVACGKGCQADKAVGLLEKMREKGVQLTEGSYSAAITACGKSGEWERALMLLEDMKDGKDNLEPNEYCFDAAIHACQRSSRWMEAIDVLRAMQSAEHAVTDSSYFPAIKACLHAGETSKAEALLEEMHAAGIRVKARTTSVVEKHAKRRTDRRRGSNSSPIVENNELPPRKFASSSLAGKEKAAVAAEAPRLEIETVPGHGPGAFEESNAGGHDHATGQTDNLGPFSTLTKGGVALSRRTTTAPPTLLRSSGASRKNFLRTVNIHAQNKQWTEITLALDKAIADPSMKVSMCMYDTCIDGLATGGMWTEAIGVLEKLQRVGLTPSSKGITATIRACARANPPQCGMAMLLLRGSKKLEVWAYVATLSALANAGQWKLSVELMEEMRQDGVKPNLHCYNSTLAAFRKAEPPQWEKACALVAQMKEDGIKLSVVSYSTAIQSCLAASEIAIAVSLMAEMIEAGCQPSKELKTLVDGTRPHQLSELLP